MKTVKEVAKISKKCESTIIKRCKKFDIQKVGNKYMLSDDDIHKILFEKKPRKVYCKLPKDSETRKTIDEQIAASKARRHQRNLKKNYFQMCG